MGLREKFINRAKSRKLESIDIGLDEPVFIRPLVKGTKSKAEAVISKADKTAKDCSDIRWIVLRDGLCDGDGEPILKAEDRNLFDSWDESFVEPIFSKILKLSGHDENEIEEFQKN